LRISIRGTFRVFQERRAQLDLKEFLVRLELLVLLALPEPLEASGLLEQRERLALPVRRELLVRRELRDRQEPLELRVLLARPVQPGRFRRI